MKKSIKGYRVIAAVCALAFLLSAINLSIFTLASGGSDAVEYITKAMTVDKNDTKNLFLNARLEANFFKDGANTWEWGGRGSATIFSGLGAWDSNESGCRAWGLLNDTTSTNAYWQLDISLTQAVNNPEKFIYYAHATDNACSRHYALFMSSDKASLYNEANKVIEVTENDTSVRRLGDIIDLTKTGKTLTNIAYVGIRFYHAYWHNRGGCPIIHYNMLALYGPEQSGGKSDAVQYITKTMTVDKNDTKNLFLNARLEANFFKDGDNTWEWGGRGSATIFSGLGAWDSNESGCRAWGLLNDTTSTNAYWQLDIALTQAVNNPEKFIYYAHATDNACSRHYALFMSSDKASLYNEANKVIEVTENDTSVKRLGDIIDLTKTGKTLTNIAYVGIRFYHAYWHNGGGCPIIHYNMLALYGGTVVKPSETRTALQSISEVDLSGINQLENGSCSGGFYVNGERTYEYSSYRIDGHLNAWHNENSTYCYTKDQPNDLIQKNTYWQMEISLSGKLSDPKSFIFLAHENANNVTSGHYAIFVSESAANLYNEENKLIEVTDSTARLGDKIDLTKLGKDIKDVRFFGIRFYHRGYTGSSGCQGQHIYLLGIYGGTYTESAVEVRNYNSAIEYGGSEQLGRDTAAIGENFIIGKQPYATMVNSSIPSNWTSMAIATDGKFDTHLDFTRYKGQDGTCDFIYRVDNDPDVIKKVEKFIFMGHSHTASWADQYLTGKYEVYAAVNYTELFDEENKIYDYDWERDGMSRLQTAVFKTDIYARYVAVRIINPVTDCKDASYQNPRIGEIAFLGKTADIADVEKNVSDNMPLEVYFEDSNGNKTDISDSISLEEYKVLFDTKTDAAVEFDTDGSRIDFVVNLLKDYKITSAVAKSVSDAGYSVYAANKFSELWAESSKISDSAYSDAGSSVKARYVRFSFDMSAGKKLALQDIEIKALSNPLIKLSEHLGLSVDNSKVSSFENPVGNTNITRINYLNNTFNLTFNGDTLCEEKDLTAGGEAGKSTLNVLVRLAALQNISEYTIAFTPHLLRYQPTKVNVYIGETFDEAMDLTRAPDKTFIGLPKLGKYTAEMKPTLARYIRIEFVDNNYGKGTENIIGKLDENDFAKTQMEFALTEIDIIGTPVVGMADDAGNLLSFEQNGVKWSVLALDENDVPTNIYFSRLVSVATTAEQKKSLYNSPYYKIVGDKAYTIEFYDIFGKKIDDIGGRSIKISFPISGNDTWLAGNASNNSEIKLYDVMTDNNTIIVEDIYSSNLRLSLLVLTDENDSYWNGITTDEPETPSVPDNSGVATPKPPHSTSSVTQPVNGNTELEEKNEQEREQQLVTVGTETKHSIIYPGVPTYLIVLIIIECVFLALCVATLLIITFKKPGKA